MPSETPAYTDDDLIALLENGEILAAIDRNERAASSPLRERYIALHNAKRVDLLSITSSSSFEALSGWHFFFIQDFFVSAIPYLDAPTDRMIDFVAKLVDKGGADLASNRPNGAFISWCASRPKQAQELVDLARSGHNTAIDHLTFALQAQNNLTDARQIAEQFSDRRRLAALTALSRIPHKTEYDRNQTISTLDRLVANPVPDDVKSAILGTILSAFSNVGAPLPEHAINLVRVCLNSPGPAVQYIVATKLADLNGREPDELIVLLLRSLANVSPDHKATIHHIDFGLRHLIKRGFQELAIGCATDLLVANNNQLTLDSLPSFAHSLLEGPPETFHNTLVRWLLLGDRALCEGMDALLRRSGKENRPLDIEMPRFSLADHQSFFICRKAIGYFFFQPVVAASILVSVLRSASGDLRKAIQALLLDPLLINYGGKLRAYLAQLSSTDAAQPEVSDALQRVDQYLDGLKSVGEIREFRPPAQHEEIARIKLADQMSAAAKDAEEESALLKLVKRSIILYGRQSLTHVYDGIGNRRPVTIQMHRHEFGFEVPKREIADPGGLYETLRIFRAERLLAK